MCMSAYSCYAAMPPLAARCVRGLNACVIVGRVLGADGSELGED